MTAGHGPPNEHFEISADKSTRKSHERLPLLQPRKEPNTLMSARYIVSYMSFFGFASTLMSRVNMSVAIIAMVNSSYSTSDMTPNSSVGVCPAPSSQNGSERKEGEFPWDSHTQEQILAAFFYGFITLQIPAGYLADKYSKSCVWIFGLGYFISSICTLFTPLAAYNGVTALFMTRFIAGVAESGSYPALYSLISRWAPPRDRSRITAISFSGVSVGQVIAQPIAGALSDSDILGGWPSSFYLFGTIGIIWFIFWICLIYDSPSSHPRISPEEKQYIITSLESRAKPPTSYPWISLLTSMPVIAVAITDFAVTWIFYTLLTNLPIFLNEALKFSITETGFIAAIPYALLSVAILGGGLLADFLNERRIASLTAVRKLMTSVVNLDSSVKTTEDHC